MKKRIIIPMLSLVFLPAVAKAHCPLCTAGAGAAAIGATWLGMSQLGIGIFIGAFAIALGLWVARLIKKKYIPYQDMGIAIFSFATTVFPLFVVMRDVTSVYIGLVGAYGSLLNKVYLLNLFFLGSLMGAGIIFVSPKVSGMFKKKNGKRLFPYQGILVTFAMLIMASLIIEFIL
jgi:hypothetical protein